jgi:hypothetical protein
MFKQAGIEDEIYRSMEKTLVSNQVENQYGFQKLAQAVNCLNAAAEIFEQAGMSETATDIAQVLESMAKLVTFEEWKDQLDLALHEHHSELTSEDFPQSVLEREWGKGEHARYFAAKTLDKLKQPAEEALESPEELFFEPQEFRVR